MCHWVHGEVSIRASLKDSVTKRGTYKRRSRLHTDTRITDGTFQQLPQLHALLARLSLQREPPNRYQSGMRLGHVAARLPPEHAAKGQALGPSADLPRRPPFRREGRETATFRNANSVGPRRIYESTEQNPTKQSIKIRETNSLANPKTTTKKHVMSWSRTARRGQLLDAKNQL